MGELTLTSHAAVRMAQRGIDVRDAELMAVIGTIFDDGYFVRNKDCDNVERILKNLLERVRRVRGKRLVVARGQIVTAYHTSKSYQRRLLRKAQERDIDNL
jgi:hypothetical protein